MPTLTLRTVGRSFVLDGIAPSGLDGRALLDALAEEYGPAVATLGTTDPTGGDGPSIDALILDRKAASRDALREWLRSWLDGRGCRYVAWAEAPLADGTTATLHFHT